MACQICHLRARGWSERRVPASRELLGRPVLSELDFPVATWRPRQIELREHFIAAVDPIGEFICDSGGKVSGEAGFAIFQNLARAMTDVLTAFHLVQHAYLNQAYGPLRSVIDACDLVELFAEQPDEAKLWVNTTQPHRDFAPRVVREKLGKEPYDPIHGFMSEIGVHPRFLGAKLTGGMLVPPKGEEGSPIAHIRIGPYFADDAPVMHAAMWCIHDLALIGLRSNHLVDVVAELAEAQWGSAYHRCVNALGDATRTVKAGLVEAGDDAELGLLDTMFDPAIEQTAQWGSG